MDAGSIAKYIADRFPGVDVTENFGYTFFFYDPGKVLPEERRFPFATIADQDYEHDRASNLSRGGLYRLNIGVEKATYRLLFGPPPTANNSGFTEAPGRDCTVISQLLPHPIYAAQSWICILSPTDEVLQSTVEPLLAEAYAQAVRKFDKLKKS